MATDPVQLLSRWRARAEARLDRIRSSPLGRRLDPYLGFSELRRFNPLLALLPMGLLLVFGLMRSQFGHMDTVPAIFPIMALISGLNPFVGILSGLAYGAGDLLQKFLVDDVFYEGVRTAGDYWGARVGYLIAYSALILFGILPGVLSRVGRRVAVRVVGDQRGGVGLPPPGPVVAGAHVIAGIVGAIVGGVAGSLTAAFAWKGAVAPAFLLRPSADHSCYALSGSNVIEAIPTASAAGGIGGGASTAAPAIPGLGVVGAPLPPAGVAPPALDLGGAPPNAQMAPPAPPGTPPAPPASPSTVAPGATQGVVVSGKEAIDELINAGFPTVTVGKDTFVKPPRSVGGAITAIGGKPITLPTGEQVLDPNDVAIVKNVPVLTGPTTTATGKDAIDAMVNEGFPTYTDPATKKIYVRHPPNLIHGNVGGIAFQGTTRVNGIDVIDPEKGVVVTRTGPPTPPKPTTTTTAPQTPQTPQTPPVPQTPQTPPVPQKPPVPPVQPQKPPVVGPPVVTPPVPPVTPPVVQVQIPKPPPPPAGPPRTPTDANSLMDSLKKPGTTVITPDNLPGFAPDILRADGTIIANGPKVPDALKKLDGLPTPRPVIRNGRVSLDLPIQLGGAEVTMSVRGGRIQADTQTHGGIAAIEGASEFIGNTPINVARSVQNRLDRYNDAINNAGLEVKQVIADGGQVRVITGPRS